MKKNEPKNEPSVSWLIALGTAMVLVCGPLSMLPAICLSERTPDARVVFEYPSGHQIWVAPWLYDFSMGMRYLALAGILASLVGIIISGIRRRH